MVLFCQDWAKSVISGPKSECDRLVRMGEKNIQPEWLQQ